MNVNGRSITILALTMVVLTSTSGTAQTGPDQESFGGTGRGMGTPGR